MRILTLNCHSWMEADQKEKIRIIAETIKEKRYDVIAMQEVNQSEKAAFVTDKIKKDNFALIVLNELENIGCNEYKLVWDFAHIGFDIYEEGIAILTRYEIADNKTIFVSKNTDKNYWKARIAVKASIKFNENIIDFYSCHMGWWGDEEENFCEQADRLLNSMKEDRLTFIMGDFNNNAFIRNQGYDYLLSKGLYDTYTISEIKDAGFTVKGKIDGWEGNKSDLRLDWILVNRLHNIKSSKVIFNGENRAVVSDHYGVEIYTD